MSRTLLFVWVNESGDEETWDPAIPSTVGATNNEMELEAPIEALKLLRRGRVPVDLGRFKKVVIRTDSTYVHDNVPHAMWTWRRSGWVKKGGASVLRSRMWKELIGEMKKLQERHGILAHFERVEGKKGRHAKTVDKLAKQSAKSASFGRKRPSIVARKTTGTSVQSGSVVVQGQTFGVRIIQTQYIPPPRRGSRYKYEVVDESHPSHQARALLEAARGDRLEALYVLAVTTGMRQGKLLGLRWRDVGLDARALAVRASLQRIRGGLIFAEPKTASSRRRITLTELALVALRRRRAAQIAERLAAGPEWVDEDLVFATHAGRLLHASYVLVGFLALLRRAALPRVRFHDLRHTAATLMLSRGVHPKVASEMLGHSTIAITLDLYSHVTPTIQRDAADAADALFSS